MAKRKPPFDNEARKARVSKATQKITGLVGKFGTKGGPRVPTLKTVSNTFLDIMQTHSPEKGGYREQAKVEIKRRQGVTYGGNKNAKPSRNRKTGGYR